MASDPDFESALQSLLDGRPFTGRPEGPDTPAALGPLGVIQAIARAHRLALFGDEGPGPATGPERVRWGHLEVGEEVGRGATGTVHRAWDTRLSRDVALKLFTADDTDAPEAALAEGRLLARVRHPHIVSVYGADTHDGVAGVWMEFVRGDTLDEVLERDGILSVEEALLVGIDLAGAVSAVHAAGLLHRDVKARNVIREHGGRVLLMDLGAGRPLDQAPAGGDSTGTPLYMAPEVLAGGAATQRSDIYSLGVVFYRLLTATYPVVASGVDDLRAAHASGRRRPLALMRADLPPAVEQAVDRACDPDPGRRFASAVDLERALRTALRDTIEAGAPVRSGAARRWARWQRAAASAATLAAILSMSVWVAWNTLPGRSARRALGLAVPPLSRLYLTINGGLVVVDGRQVTVAAGNPATAVVVAASSDLGVRTLASMPPWTDGAAFDLDGRPVAGPHPVNTICCFSDGTTDGHFNYAVRQDSTLLEPRGSRPLAPTEVYRFGRDWSDPQPLFRLTQSGEYRGIAYAARTQTFWTTRNEADAAVLEQWSLDGRLVSPPVRVAPTLAAAAVDPLDATLWVVRYLTTAQVLRLENFDEDGRHLATLDLGSPALLLSAGGAEFAWRGPR